MNQKLCPSLQASSLLLYSVFYLLTGGNVDEIIAIDDVSVIDRKCDDDYVEIENYQDYLNTYAVDESFLTPTMVSEQGYNFKLKVRNPGMFNAYRLNTNIRISSSKFYTGLPERTHWICRRLHVDELRNRSRS